MSKLTDQDRAAAENFLETRWDVHQWAFMSDNKRVDLIETYLAGILHERQRAENILLKALELVKQHYDTTGVYEIASEALKTWRGEK